MNKDKTINIGTPKSIYKIFKNILLYYKNIPIKKQIINEKLNKIPKLQKLRKDNNVKEKSKCNNFLHISYNYHI